MKKIVLALFGEAEKGDLIVPYYLHSLPQLVDYLGHPPPESQGLHFAVQALLYHQELIFFRVREEGYSDDDYFSGLRLLSEEKEIPELAGICLPGVGDQKIIEAVVPLCQKNNSLMITTEPDLYDYLTSRSL